VKIRSFNEWDQLRECYVGVADYANWPTEDPVFANESEKTLWKETPVPSGAVEPWIIEEANQDLDSLAAILEQQDVKVNRPSTGINFQALGGMYNYCPRDRFLIAGREILDPAMMYPCRDMEQLCYKEMLTDNTVKKMPRKEDMVLDAANICRLGKDWIYLESDSGNTKAYEWLCEQYPSINIEKVNFYAGVHIDSTIVPLREGLAICNKPRVKSKRYLPPCMKDWEIIWVEDVTAQVFYQYPYASKWIGLNMLSINDHTIIVDTAQLELSTILEKKGFTVIPHTLRHSRTLGGGHHCVTLDTWREND
jgi:N-dimethylarginine dimethylaminohydrolase